MVPAFLLPDGSVHVTVTATDGVGLQSTVPGAIEIDAAMPPLLAVWTFDRDLPCDEPVEVEDSRERTDQVTLTAWMAPSVAGPMSPLGACSRAAPASSVISSGP